MCLKNLFKKSEPKPVTDYAEIARKFKEIADSPYDVAMNNCVQKAHKLAYAIQENHGHDVILVQITHQSDGNRHAFLKWEGDLVCDPTMKPPKYRVEYDEYITTLHKSGFTHTPEENRLL